MNNKTGYLICLIYGICNKNNYSKMEWFKIIESGNIICVIEEYLDDILKLENDLIKFGIKQTILSIYDDCKNDDDLLKILDNI